MPHKANFFYGKFLQIDFNANQKKVPFLIKQYDTYIHAIDAFQYWFFNAYQTPIQ